MIIYFLFDEFQALRAEAADKYEQASSKLAELKHKKEVTEKVVEEAQKRNDEIKEQLKSNENYRQISHLEERLSDIIDETKSATTTLDQLQKACEISGIFQNPNCVRSINSVFFLHSSLQEHNYDDVVFEAKEKLDHLFEFLRSNTQATAISAV